MWSRWWTVRSGPGSSPLTARPIERLRVVYVGDGPRGYEGLAIYPYYYAWQRTALRWPSASTPSSPSTSRTTSATACTACRPTLHRLPIPFIWGPVGGGEAVPLSFIRPRWLGRREAAMELLRWAWNLWVRVDPRIRACARGAAVPVATTDQTRDALPRDVRRRTVVMRNAVLTPEDRALLGSRRAGPGPTTGLRCMFAGRLLGWKGPTLAVEAFAAYAADHPTAVLDVYGEGPLAADVRARAAASGVADRVVLHGRVPARTSSPRTGSTTCSCSPACTTPGGPWPARRSRQACRWCASTRVG